MRDLIQELKDEGKTVFFSTHILSDAEALCDRVAILNRGELRGIGVVAELAARVRGQVEVLWEGSAALTAMRTLAGQVHAAGEVFRAVIAEAQLEEAIDTLRRHPTRLVSVIPIRSTLEDYFVEQLAASPPDKKEPSSPLAEATGPGHDRR